MICRKCGADVNENLYLCPKCGAVLKDSPLQVRRAASPAPADEALLDVAPLKNQNSSRPPVKRPNGLIALLIVLILILVALIATGVYFLLGGFPGVSSENGIETISSSYEQGLKDAVSKTKANETQAPAQDSPNSPDTAEEFSGERAVTEASQTESAVADTVAVETEERYRIDMAKVNEIFASDSAEYGIYIKDLRNVVEYKNTLGDSSMSASALINVPILYTVASLVDSGSCSLSDTVRFYYSMDGRGRKTKSEDGNYFTISELLEDMLKFSDNNATNSMLTYLGMDRITQVCHDGGFDSVDINIFIGETSTMDNYVSANDLGQMLEVLYNDYFQSIGKDYMKNNFVISDKTARKGIGKNIPEVYGFLNHNGVKAEKYNEAAIVYGEDAEYIIVVLSNYGVQDTEAENAAEAAAYIHDCLTRP